jgi:hypothetical protein
VTGFNGPTLRYIDGPLLELKYLSLAKHLEDKRNVMHCFFSVLASLNGLTLLHRLIIDGIQLFLVWSKFRKTLHKNERLNN